MNTQKAKDFIRKNARPVELAEFQCHFEDGSRAALVQALSVYQNADGGFGHALEPDSWNPASSPITTNDAIGRLFEAGALDEAGAMTESIVRYLTGGGGFDREKQRWLFAIESNRNYPHAVWWEKNGDGISGWNPTVSLAAFLIYTGTSGPWREMVKEAFLELEQAKEKSEGSLKCYILAYKMLQRCGAEEVIDFDRAGTAIRAALSEVICQDTGKYGVEYVPAPSWFFQNDRSFLSEEIQPLIREELEALDRLQMEDGGFDISWQWYTPYPEAFEQARAWWRPRVTTEKLRFLRLFEGENAVRQQPQPA